MRVRIDGQAWLYMDELTIQQLDNIREQLTIYPRKTTDIATKKDPDPIFLFEEVGSYLGVPRGWYRENLTKKHEEIIDVSRGAKMAELSTRYKADGPYVEQAAVLRMFEHRMEGLEWGGLLLKAGCAFGKALRNGEPVLTRDGYVPIESLCVGDKVAGTDGDFHSVTGVFPQGVRDDLYRVVFTDGTHVDCDADHLWTFVMRKRRGKTVTITTREMIAAGLREKAGRKFWLPDVSLVHLSSKADIINTSTWQREIGRAVKDVVAIDACEATCISVDSPDHLFLTRGCVPTHNTATALEFARRMGRRTLILVHKEFFLKQWEKRIKYFMPDARVGIIRQKKCEFKDKDFVIGMLQSLARDDSGKYPEDVYRAFGLVISDEVHRTSASTWSKIIPRFNAAWRLGLSATPRRKDGAQNVFFYHISKITYSAKTQAQVPGLRILRTYSRLEPISRGTYYVSPRNMNSAQILTQLGKDEFRAKDIVDDLIVAVQGGRKVMVVSERISHLKMMSDMLTNSLFKIDLPFIPKIDFYTGEWFTGGVWETTTKGHRRGDPKTAKRKDSDLEKAESANVIFATKQMVEEGLDIEALDVVVLSLPMSDVEQTVGRVRRWCFAEPEKCKRLCPWRAGKCMKKPDPVVLDVVDEGIDQLDPKWKARKRFYLRIGTMVEEGKSYERGKNK